MAPSCSWDSPWQRLAASPRCLGTVPTGLPALVPGGVVGPGPGRQGLEQSRGQCGGLLWALMQGPQGPGRFWTSPHLLQTPVSPSAITMIRTPSLHPRGPVNLVCAEGRTTLPAAGHAAGSGRGVGPPPRGQPLLTALAQPSPVPGFEWPRVRRAPHPMTPRAFSPSTLHCSGACAAPDCG